MMDDIASPRVTAARVMGARLRFTILLLLVLSPASGQTACPSSYMLNTTDGTCAACPAGTFSGGGSATVCASCPKGTFNPSLAGSCASCPYNSFSIAAKPVKCLTCAAEGTWQGITGPTARSVCRFIYLDILATLLFLTHGGLFISAALYFLCAAPPPDKPLTAGAAPSRTGFALTKDDLRVRRRLFLTMLAPRMLSNMYEGLAYLFTSYPGVTGRVAFSLLYLNSFMFLVACTYSYVTGCTAVARERRRSSMIAPAPLQVSAYSKQHISKRSSQGDAPSTVAAWPEATTPPAGDDGAPRKARLSVVSGSAVQVKSAADDTTLVQAQSDDALAAAPQRGDMNGGLKCTATTEPPASEPGSTSNGTLASVSLSGLTTSNGFVSKRVSVTPPLPERSMMQHIFFALSLPVLLMLHAVAYTTYLPAFREYTRSFNRLFRNRALDFDVLHLAPTDARVYAKRAPDLNLVVWNVVRIAGLLFVVIPNTVLAAVVIQLSVEANQPVKDYVLQIGKIILAAYTLVRVGGEMIVRVARHSAHPLTIDPTLTLGEACGCITLAPNEAHAGGYGMDATAAEIAQGIGELAAS